MNTLAEMYEYSTTMYEKNKLSELLGNEDQKYTYGSFRQVCDYWSARLTRYGIGAGDRVAILSQNMPNWTVAFFSLTAFGRVVVPILPDSSATEVNNILEHSGCKAVFVSKKQMGKLSEQTLSKLALVIDLETLSIVRRDDNAYTCDARVIKPLADDIAAIIYTSGTTGGAKGVMLSHRNFVANVRIAWRAYPVYERDRWLSILPQPHTYELSVGTLYSFYTGSCTYYMSKPPTAAALLPALKAVRPTVMLSVPLVIEKVYKNSVVPTIRRSKLLSWLEGVAPALLYKIIGMKLRTTFGGHLGFFGVGGSKLDPTVEAFLLAAGFPYAIGYGMTECAPLICTSVGRQRVVGSTGYKAYCLQLRLADVNPETGEGEIQVKGDNVMLGYYKEATKTRAMFTDDGWMKTNDLGWIDEKGKVYIRGRLNNMILGPSGENIYPEEIEQVINNLDTVNESLVVERNGRLVALVQFNENIIDWNQEGEDRFFKRIEELKATVLSYVNMHVNKASKVSDIEVMKEPFEKTATQKIRRFKYKK